MLSDDLCNVESSAYKSMSTFLHSNGKSLMYIRKSNGPKIEPWGTPERTINSSDFKFSISTICFLFDKYELSINRFNAD